MSWGEPAPLISASLTPPSPLSQAAFSHLSNRPQVHPHDTQTPAPGQLGGKQAAHTARGGTRQGTRGRAAPAASVVSQPSSRLLSHRLSPSSSSTMRLCIVFALLVLALVGNAQAVS